MGTPHPSRARKALVKVICEDGIDHCGVAMRDPEGNEFDINGELLARHGRHGKP